MTLDQFQPGVRVYTKLPDTPGGPAQKKLGTVGRIFGNPMQTIVRFDDGGVVKVTENVAKWFELEPQN